MSGLQLNVCTTWGGCDFVSHARDELYIAPGNRTTSRRLNAKDSGAA